MRWLNRPVPVSIAVGILYALVFQSAKIGLVFGGLLLAAGLLGIAFERLTWRPPAAPQQPTASQPPSWTTETNKETP